MQTLKVMMVGPRGVGKSSLLAAMYERLQPEFIGTGCRLTPESTTGAKLAERLGQLKILGEEFPPTGGRTGDTKVIDYEFDIGPVKGKPSLQMIFSDVPGRYYSADADASESKEVDNRLTQAVASVIAIDTPALMEEHGKYHETINLPGQIRDLYQRVLSGAEDSRFVILAPVRCEAYLAMKQGKSRAKELLDKVKKGYEALLDVLQQNEFRDRVAVVITPVQTVGCLRFSRFEMTKAGPEAVFRKFTHESVYKPVDCEQPLRYILRYLLDLHTAHIQQNGGVLDWLLPDFVKKFLRSLPLPDFFNDALAKLFSDDRHLQDAINKVSQGLKRDGDGFAIVQGGNFFAPRS